MLANPDGPIIEFEPITKMVARWWYLAKLAGVISRSVNATQFGWYEAKTLSIAVDARENGEQFTVTLRFTHKPDSFRIRTNHGTGISEMCVYPEVDFAKIGIRPETVESLDPRLKTEQF